VADLTGEDFFGSFEMGVGGKNVSQSYQAAKGGDFAASSLTAALDRHYH